MPAYLRRTTMSCLLAAALVVGINVGSADARVGGGFSVGSRGLKTYSPPPVTRTAPTAAAPVQRSAQPTATVTRAAAASPSRFGTGLIGGLFGAGLFGMLLGAGIFGGLGSLMGILGFALQAALIYGLVMLAIGYFRSRTATAGAPTGTFYRPMSSRPTSMADNLRQGSPSGMTGTGMGMGAGMARAPSTQALSIGQADFASFERLLSVIQLAFGRADVAALGSATTPEMLGYFQEQLADNAKKGVRNEMSAPTLTSGDLAESWTEGNDDYATVAMRYSLLDWVVDIASAQIVSGSKTKPQDVTEVWTFTRRAGGGAQSWRLSAIQQVS